MPIVFRNTPLKTHPEVCFYQFSNHDKCEEESSTRLRFLVEQVGGTMKRQIWGGRLGFDILWN
jgi:hypothetical protein